MSSTPQPDWESAHTYVCAIAAATVQIELALYEAKAPVEHLGGIIGRLAAVLREIDCVVKDSGSLAANGLDLRLERVRADLSGSIECMQFYDRMEQHLSHVSEYLTGIASQLANDAGGGNDGHSSPGREEAWNALHARLRRRLLSSSQRQLFDSMLPPATSVGERESTNDSAVDEGHAAHGSVELF